MEKDSHQVKRIEDKSVYFVRVKGDIYRQIKKIADEDERTIHWTVNKLLEKQLASAKNDK